MNIPIGPFNNQPGVWLRSAFHVHTTQSDGWLTPLIQRRYHAMADYDVLAITDHDQMTPIPDNNDNLLVIGGTEISLTAPKSGGPLHVLGVGITEMPAVARSITALANPPYGGQVTAGSHSLTYHAQRLRTPDGQTLEGLTDGELLTGATFRWSPGVRYVRLMITDTHGRRAWSNPIWADDFAR